MNTLRQAPTHARGPAHARAAVPTQPQRANTLQPKTAHAPHAPQLHAAHAPAAVAQPARPQAPPAYRPQPVPKVLQPKSAAAHQPQHAHAKPAPPPFAAGRPHQAVRTQPSNGTPLCLQGRCAVQPKAAAPPTQRATPAAPPVYRPVQNPSARPVAAGGQSMRAGVGVLQRLKGPGSPGVFQRPAAGSPSNVIQRHHKMTLDDTTEADAEIYIITTDMTATKADNVLPKKVVYVGQTCKQVGLDKRFDQHLKVHTDWSKLTHQPLLREDLKQCTQLEVTAAERYWYDHYLLNGAPLENAIVPITKDTFLYYKTSKTFRGKEKKFPSGDSWAPKD